MNELKNDLNLVMGKVRMYLVQSVLCTVRTYGRQLHSFTDCLDDGDYYSLDGILIDGHSCTISEGRDRLLLRLTIKPSA